MEMETVAPKRTRKRNLSVAPTERRVRSLPEQAFKQALVLAGGDASRLDIQSDGSVMIRNRKITE